MSLHSNVFVGFFYTWFGSPYSVLLVGIDRNPFYGSGREQSVILLDHRSGHIGYLAPWLGAVSRLGSDIHKTIRKAYRADIRLAPIPWDPNNRYFMSTKGIDVPPSTAIELMRHASPSMIRMTTLILSQTTSKRLGLLFISQDKPGQTCVSLYP
jgi:hypothetical protein